ncbi:sensor histidine kinase [Wenjunlia tyrosinilytica]|uniref:histidine kinase n=1 Tax=Wenjunlia tyrosinilytica TaxID=1544741 RepID=A0A917ZWG7_9ACTN|nr:HAMP domain-containing sensor histidine kinase [Wenjunlia tyrosinilytica]GGO97875.1 two-component sensor histidine kinase [Wenjunlia tyrosinilytica]
MGRRLLAVLMALMGVASIALSLPLAGAYAHSRTEHLLLQRRAEAVRFGDIADRVVTGVDLAELTTEIDRYAQLYGSGVQILDAQGRPVAVAGPRTALSGQDAEQARERALTGRSTGKLPTIRPWGPRQVVLAEPVGQDEQLKGAVLLAVPTGAARHDITVRWILIGVGALAAFAAAALVAVWVTRWLLRPVRALDRAVVGFGTGSLEDRAVVGGGPPELRRLEERFNEMAEAVSVSIRRQRDFVADASHQLRNPLATLVLQLENVEPHLVPAGRGELARAVDETERLGGLLDGLLALARVESAVQELTELDVSRAARDRAAVWGAVLCAAGVELVATVSGGVRARALPGAVDRVLDALLDNASKFVPSGGRVEIVVTSQEGQAVVRVSDDGPGAPAEQVPALTRRFARGAEHQNLPGSGLGLAIAEEIARVSGGRLAVACRAPHGLSVELILPGIPS